MHVNTPWGYPGLRDRDRVRVPPLAQLHRSDLGLVEGDRERDVDVANATDNVVDSRIITPPAETGRVVVRVVPGTQIDESATADMIEALRSGLDTSVPNAKVGGPAGQNHDLTQVLGDRAPYAIAIILIVAFVLLLVVFRSVAIATFSILMNLITVGAAFGFATLVFQHGYGTSLIGIQHQGFVDAWAPLFFFALLFGLSMDYQLFLWPFCSTPPWSA